MEIKKEEKSIVTIIKGSIIAIIITILGLFILSIILTYTDVKDTISTPIIITIAGISVIVGSIISSKKVRKKGLINGGLVGLIYIIIIYLSSSIFISNFSMNLYTIIIFLISIITGILGGVIGVNL